MLHRFALRVLPSLTLAVTEDSVRTRKRLVMFVPGLVAFAVYRAAKQGFSLAEPLTLLILSGLVSMATAICAYRVGRAVPFGRLVGIDGARRIGWVLVWIGFVYGVQLSLLVLALLWLVGYDYAKHPDGPAMMALIISSTAVARDAFEIGYVRWLEASGRPFVTFPDGVALRTLLQRVTPALMAWVAAGVVSCVGLSVLMATAVSGDMAVLAQGAVVTMTAGTVALLAFFAGQGNGEVWRSRFAATHLGGADEVLVVARVGLCFDLLSGPGRGLPLYVEAADEFDGTVRRSRWPGWWHHGIVLLLPGASSRD